jgi:hypothetical protein
LESRINGIPSASQEQEMEIFALAKPAWRPPVITRVEIKRSMNSSGQSTDGAGSDALMAAPDAK